MVALRPGAPDMASSLRVGPIGRRRGPGPRRGAALSRPSWSLDDAIWIVVDGNNVVRVIQEAASGQPARIPIDSTAVQTRFPGAINELALSRDGTRAAMVIDGQVIIAGVEQTAGGQFALNYPRRLGFGLGNTAVSLSWADRRRHRRHPHRSPTPGVRYSNLDGVNSDGPGSNLLIPVTTVAANPSTVYVADQRGVLQLSGSAAEGDLMWAEVRPLMVAV